MLILLDRVVISNLSHYLLPLTAKLRRYCFHPFVCLSVCEQFPDHNFNCGVMKLSGINCYIKIWK